MQGDMTAFTTKSFNATVRGFHVYRTCWTPQENEFPRKKQSF